MFGAYVTGKLVLKTLGGPPPPPIPAWDPPGGPPKDQAVKGHFPKNIRRLVLKHTTGPGPPLASGPKPTHPLGLVTGYPSAALDSWFCTEAPRHFRGWIARHPVLYPPKKNNFPFSIFHLSFQRLAARTSIKLSGKVANKKTPVFDVNWSFSFAQILTTKTITLAII